MIRRVACWTAWLVLGALGVSVAVAETRSARGEFAATLKGTPIRLLASPHGTTREITLAAPRVGEPNAITKAQIEVGKHRPLRIGFVRTLSEGERRIPLETLAWQSLADSKLAHVKVSSRTASGVRLSLGFDGVSGALQARFTGTSGNGQVFAAEGSELMKEGVYWSPVLEGETAIVELLLPPGASVAGDMIIHGVGHLVVAGSRLKTIEDIGTAGACEQDVACTMNASTALLNAARSVAQTIMTDGDFVVLCTGTLLNSVPRSNIPYLMTAYHCFDGDHVRTVQEVQAVASSMTLYWFFDATGCGTDAPANYIQTGGGGTLLYRASDIDFILFQLNADPPPGAWFSGWDATPLFPGTGALVLHHPGGDLKKLSFGATEGYGPFNDKGSYIEMRYSVGTTEPGSSGAPLFTCSGPFDCSEYKVRGALYGGDASCDRMSGTDQYSRLDLAYPYIAKYLQPHMSFPAGDNVALEFYNVYLDHYFATATAGEQNAVDGGSAGPGWFRTGYGFKTAGVATGPGVAQACRFYGSVWPGPNSHFYTVDPEECQFLRDLQAVRPESQPRWNYEGLAFANFPSLNGSCPSGTTPIFRYYNNGFPYKDSNHRFVTDTIAGAFMLSEGWSLEGTAMCAPK